jgi:4-diphosphocytidyl-2-C-methyl-D-erythritol kinase
MKFMVYKKQFRTIGKALLVRAPAKLNLGLLIAGKRPDGFHEIETIMAKINWFDEILIQRGTKPGIELLCKGPHWAPAGQENLVYKACKSLLDSCGKSANLKITLTKNIPAGTGLGSASSDAAATLLGVNRLLRLAVKPKRLQKIAAQLGSDVAFFLDGPLAFCTGKGEKISKLRKNFSFSALVILPDISVSTKKVYENYRHNPDLYKRLHSQIIGLIKKNRVDLVPEMCVNMLQESSFGLCREIEELKTKIESTIGKCMCLSGSGSAMFCIIKRGDEQTAIQYQAKIRRNFGCKSVIVKNNKW